MEVVATAEFCSAIYIGICFASSVARGNTDRTSDYVFKGVLLFDFILLLASGMWHSGVWGKSSFLSEVCIWISFICYYLVLFLLSLYIYFIIKSRWQDEMSGVWYVIPMCCTACGLLYWLIWEGSGVFNSVAEVSADLTYWIGQLFGYILAIWTVIMVLTFKKALPNIQFMLFLLVILIPAVVAVLRSTTDFPNLLQPAMAIMIFMIYVKDYIDEQQRFLRQKERLTDAELSMMISQVQPHFLYNMFNTIYYLCAKDVEEAQEAIGEFSDYLRTNLDSLSKREPVPFEEELENIERYVYLEKLRFEDKLDVIYDIETVDFNVPVLSIRPLVENAIKHGVGKVDRKLIVRIASRKLSDCYEVEVSDNGPGYDPAVIPNDGRTHVGLDNLRQRLILISGSSLSISGVKGVGTTATIHFK